MAEGWLFHLLRKLHQECQTTTTFPCGYVNWRLQLLFVLLHCLTPGANYIDVPTAYYGKERGHKSWYQGLRYAANNYCKQNAEEKQDYATFAASVKAGITESTCAVDTCPASGDVNAELSLIVGKGKDHWGINSNGTCYPLINSYMGSYLCDPDNMFSKCASPRNESTTPKSNAISAFNYQIDAISSKLAYISARTRVSTTTKWSGLQARMDMYAGCFTASLCSKSRRIRSSTSCRMRKRTTRRNRSLCM